MDAVRLLSAVIAAAITFSAGTAQAEEKAARVAVAVSDLRAEPVPPAAGLDHDPLEESQLLYAERVLVLEERSGWTRVEAVEQSEWSHSKRWTGYPGWIRSSDLTSDPGRWSANLLVTAKIGRVRETPLIDGKTILSLSLGTGLMGVREESWWKLRLVDGKTGWISENDVRSRTDPRARGTDVGQLRRKIVETARLLVGDPYYWGGRSAHNPDRPAPPQTAVDCSGLTGLAYQANGIQIPRDAHEQWMRAQPVRLDQLEPGDLVFLHDEKNPEKVTHVMLYAGEGRIIEGPGTGSPVREVPLSDRLQEIGGREVSCGSYLE